MPLQQQDVDVSPRKCWAGGVAVVALPNADRYGPPRRVLRTFYFVGTNAGCALLPALRTFIAKEGAIRLSGLTGPSTSRHGRVHLHYLPSSEELLCTASIGRLSGGFHTHLPS